MYSMIISTKSSSLCMCLTNPATLVLQLHDCGSYVSGPLLAPLPQGMQKFANLRVSDLGTLPTCDDSLGSLTLLTP
jgi:hypothetical protein